MCNGLIEWMSTTLPAMRDEHNDDKPIAMKRLEALDGGIPTSWQ